MKALRELAQSQAVLTATPHGDMCEHVALDSFDWCSVPASVTVRASVRGARPQYYRFCAAHAEIGASDLLSIYTHTEIVS